MADRVGFIGLGTMGMPMATNLAKGGVPLVVHDASPAALTAAAKLPGAIAAGSVAEVAAQAAVIFTCLPNDTIVSEVYLGPGGIASAARAGLITCDCSTVSPEATTAVHAALKGRGVDHMDTPMLGSQPQAVEGQIFFIVGGEKARLATIAPYLELMGK
ncbi:MAG TPA: NAD(P)-binding domain-containing protein, partial [Gemmatimonadales bacterium]|nr:NAD(P)-binding domain-containing protein [Gemmatimonadales bacterium]